MLVVLGALLFVMSASAGGGEVILNVGVHRLAGDVAEVTAVGASGPCVRAPSKISCPASGAVEFHWAGDTSFELQGVTKVYPGERALSFVLSAEQKRVDERALLQTETVSAEEILGMFVQIEETLPPVLSLGMVDDLIALSGHSEPLVRRAVVDSLFPLMRDTASDPFWPHAPDVVPDGLLLGLTQDKDKGVRRRLALLLREGRSGSLDMERQVALRILATDPKTSVRRPAIAALPRAVQLEIFSGEMAWFEALGRVPLRLGAGRAAVGALTRMSKKIEASESVVPEKALELAVRYHPEQAWNLWAAWREALPFHSGRAEVLIFRTAGLNKALLRSWAEQAPTELAVLLSEWRGRNNTSHRFELVQSYLNHTENDELRKALALPVLED